MFCYAGVAGTFTPLHADVYSSYSWSTNVVGRKLWNLFPPDVALYLKRSPENRRSEHIFDVRAVDVSRFPQWPQAEEKMIVVEQHPGETIFIPSGWYHQVENITDCISLNHNWCNSVNLPSMYEAMKNEVDDVSEAISDVKEMIYDSHHNGATGGYGDQNWMVEWLRQVDNLVRMDSGWGWVHFFKMIADNIDEELMNKPVHHRPSAPFVVSRVKLILNDFRTREEYMCLPEVRAIVDRAQTLLGRINSIQLGTDPS